MGQERETNHCLEKEKKRKKGEGHYFYRLVKTTTTQNEKKRGKLWKEKIPSNFHSLGGWVCFLGV